MDSDSKLIDTESAHAQAQRSSGHNGLANSAALPTLAGQAGALPVSDRLEGTRACDSMVKEHGAGGRLPAEEGHPVKAENQPNLEAPPAPGPPLMAAKRKRREDEAASEALMALSQLAQVAGEQQPSSCSTPNIEGPAVASMAPMSYLPPGTDGAVPSAKLPWRTTPGPGQSWPAVQPPRGGDFIKHKVEAKQPRKRKRKEKEEEVALAPGEPLLHALPPSGSPWVPLSTTLRAGKYKGRRAVVLGLAKKKYRVQVVGLEYQLEFYPSYVGLPAPPEGYASSPGSPPPAQPPGHGAQPAWIGLPLPEGQGAATGPAAAAAPAAPGASLATQGSVAPGRAGSASSGGTESQEFRAKHAHWVGESLQIQRGKYQGRLARILGLTSAKLQVSVPGVEHQLEYYPSMFRGPPPKTITAE